MAFPFIKQYDSMDCGPACIAMISNYYGKKVPMQHLREKTQIGKTGVNLLGISNAAEHLGFRTTSVRLSFASLANDARLPCILFWNQNHFVVLHKIKGRKLFIADPGQGLLTYTEKEFLEGWINDFSAGDGNGIALMLEPTPAFHLHEQEKSVQKKTLKNVLNYIWPYKKLLLQLFLGLALASILQLILPFLTQSIVDVGINTGNMHFIYIVLLGQIALFTGRITVEFIRGWILLHISTRINVSILIDFLIKLMKLPVSFFESKQTGDILQRMNDHHRVEQFLTGSSLNVLFSLLNLLVFSIVLIIYNPVIFGIFAGASILYSTWVILFLKQRRTLDHKQFDLAAQEQSATIQLILGMQEIKLHNCEKHMRWNWEHLQARKFRLRIKGLSLEQWQQSGAFFINEGKNIFITFMAAKAVINGEMTLGSMLAVQYIIGQLNSPIEQMIGFLQSWQNAKISIERLNEIHSLEDEEQADGSLLQELPLAFSQRIMGGKGHLTYEEQMMTFEGPQTGSYVPEAPDLPTKKRDEPAIVFNDVTYTYPGAGNEPVLRNINLLIPLGKTTAIVGTSGSGKTTLLKLLLKFVEPVSGNIKLGNTSLSNISHKLWRGHCGVVMQDSFIFSDTIAANIALGEERIDIRRLQFAASTANILSFIESLPLGFNTKIGVQGTGLSMGQRQRLLIARAVFKNPDFIFFDEATNSLDANNESIIVRNLEAFSKNKTVVVVAHRLSTVRNAGQIVVLREGTIVETGTHDQLINAGGYYFELIKNQLELGQ